VANSELENKNFYIPDNVKILIRNILNTATSKKEVGYNRLEHYLYKGLMSYDDLKNIIKYNKNGQLYFSGTELGGKFIKWCNEILEKNRNGIKKKKEFNSSQGMENQFRKTHTKNENLHRIIKEIVYAINKQHYKSR
jgi:hypothetical protein